MAGFSYTATTRPLSSPAAVSTNEQCVRPNACPTRRTSVWKISSARSAAETSWKMSKSRSRARSASRAPRTSSRNRSSASRRACSSCRSTGARMTSFAPADSTPAAPSAFPPSSSTNTGAPTWAGIATTSRTRSANRDSFVPPTLAANEYEDAPLPIGNGQTTSHAFVVAVMTAVLAGRRRDVVLEIGTGSGYQTAILARLAQRVATVERLPDLLVEAEVRFQRLGLTNIDTRLGDGARGWPEHAPFNGILVTAAAPHIPPPLLEQLALGGRLVIPLGDLATQELVIVTRGRDGWTERRAGGVRFVPLVSSLAFTEPVEP